MNFSLYITLFTLTAAALLGGCDSSGTSTPAVTSSAGATSTSTNGRGSVKITVRFPSVGSRAAGASSAASGTSGVPIGAQSVKIDITDPTTSTSLAQSQIITSPSASAVRRLSVVSAISGVKSARAVPSRASSVTASFDSVRGGLARIVASAYNTPDASGPAVGLASTVQVNGAGAPTTNFTVPADGTSVSVTPIMTSTATSIQVTATPTTFDGMTATGPAVPLSKNGTAPPVVTPDSAFYTAKLFDSNGVELMGSPLVFSSGNSLILKVSTANSDPTTALDPAVATLRVTGSGDSTAQIEVRDPNSGNTFDFNQEVIPTF